MPVQTTGIAFPTAYGGGSSATGGSGGAVIHVTNLNDSGAGSLREALLTTGTRTIVFDVSGRIQLQSAIHLQAAHSNLTVAGHTAPSNGITGGGITIGGYPIDFSGYDPGDGQQCNNWIIRYVKFRNNNKSWGAPWYDFWMSGLRTNGSDSFIIDSCTFSHCYDQGITANAKSNSLTNGTLQRCHFADNRTATIFGYMQDWGQSQSENLTVVNNLFQSGYRNPNHEGTGRVDVINNFIYNRAARTININGGTPQVNHIGNYYEDQGVDTSYRPCVTQGNGDGYQIYSAYNYNDNYTPTPFDNDGPTLWRDFGSTGDVFGSPFVGTQHTPLVGRTYTIQTAAQARADIIVNSGAHKSLNADGSVTTYLDTWDIHKLNNIDIGSIDNFWVSYDSGLEYPLPTTPTISRPGGYYNTNAHIPETWLQANVPSPDANSHNELAPSGYTWLEEFLNQVDTYAQVGDIPVITLIGNSIINLDNGDAYVEQGATATDAEDGNISPVIIGGDIVNTSIDGTYIVTYDIQDSDLNWAVQKTRTVNVITSTPGPENVEYNLSETQKAESKQVKIRLIKTNS